MSHTTFLYSQIYTHTSNQRNKEINYCAIWRDRLSNPDRTDNFFILICSHSRPLCLRPLCIMKWKGLAMPIT